MRDTPCTPRARYTERAEAAEAAAKRLRDANAAKLTQRLSDAEQASLNDPDRPRVLRPQDWPEKIVVRIICPALPGAIVAEIGSAPGDSTSWTLTADSPEMAMAGAEVALAALGYTLDRFRLYSDMSLMVGTFYRREGPYA